MKLTEKLDLLMEEKGIKRADLSRETGIPYSTLSSLYDKGYENVKLTTLKKLAEYFECSLDYIADDTVVEKWPISEDKKIRGEYKVAEDIEEYVPQGIKLFPVVGIVRAGQPIFAQENIEGYFPIDNSFIDKDKEYFFLKVKGDSMNLEFKEGSLLLIEKISCLENGEIGVILVNGCEATVKKVVKNDNMITLIPMSNNPEYTPMMINIKEQEVSVIGRVKMAIKQY